MSSREDSRPGAPGRRARARPDRRAERGRKPPGLLARAVLASAAVAPLAACGGADDGRPNVLFLAVDDLNDWVGCLGGHPDAETPHIDRLAARGTLFTNAHCAVPLCNPSRVSVLTGLHPTTTGVFTNTQRFREVLPAVETLPQRFAASGYRVAGGGKLFHAPFPDPESWQEYFPSHETVRPPDPLPDERPIGGYSPTLDWGPLDVPEEAMSDAKIARWAAGELGREHDRPFFLAVGFFRPHLPWSVPRPYHERFPPGSVRLPEVRADDLDDIHHDDSLMRKNQKRHAALVGRGLWPEAVSSYLASVSFLDAQVGRVLDALDAGPNADDTIVVLWSDHGIHLGEKEHWKKKTPWEESTRVPLVLAGPGVRAGRRNDHPVGLIDLYPTLVELCGLDPPVEPRDGFSLVPLLHDPEAVRGRPAITSLGPSTHALRSERWRYVTWPLGAEELYDHERDPNEWTNLAADPRYAGVKRDMRRWLEPSGAGAR